jgi:excisionase family DNA binding protein
MAEVAEFLGISKRSVQRFAATGKLHVHRFGRAVRVSEADIAIFLAEHQSF